MARFIRTPKSGRCMNSVGPLAHNDEMNYTVKLQREVWQGQDRIVVYILDNYNQYAGYTRMYEDTPSGYQKARVFFRRLAQFKVNGRSAALPFKVPAIFVGTLPEGI